MLMTIKEAKEIAGNLSKTSKMPGYSWGISAIHCKTGSKLKDIEGSVCASCYALKGNYMWPNVVQAHEKRLQGYYHAKWVDAMVTLINHYCKDEPYFRWFDSGDLQSVLMLLKIARVANRTPTVKHWLPTREYGIVSQFHEMKQVLPDNLNVRTSAHMINSVLVGRLPQTTASTVADGTTAMQGFVCGASTRGGKCGSCRQCWDRNVGLITYRLH